MSESKHKSVINYPLDRSMLKSNVKRIKLTHKYCPHCRRQCNIKTYRSHKRLYFSRETKSWSVPQLAKADNDLESAESDFESPGSSDGGAESAIHSCSDDDNLLDLDLSPGRMEPKHAQTSTTTVITKSTDIPDSSGCSADPEIEYWMDSDSELDQDCIDMGQQDVPASSRNRGTQPLVWWIVLFVSIFQTLHSVSDRAIDWLLKFLGVLLKFCGSFSPTLQKAAEAFPNSLFLRDKFLRGCSQNVTVHKYTVCSSCHTLYENEQCWEKVGRKFQTKKCSNKLYSHMCGTNLLRRIVSKSGSPKLYPYVQYCYCSLIATLQDFLLRPGFVDSCESTRNLSSQKPDDMLSDIYHGKIWTEFLKVNGRDFLSASFCYGLMINMDWFQPFEHISYSVGVVYLVLLNLPRVQRYKRQNVIIVGIIPGPHEPPLTINSYLSPLVTELLQLWSGVKLKIFGSGENVIRAALLAVACDMPASRKVSGFLSHSANLGCPRCYCEFSKGSLNRDYSNFDRSSWCYRDNSKHRKDVERLLNSACTSKTAKSKLESELGCRYSILLQLPYFDPVRMTLVDPMHNLFLGSAKYVTKDILVGTAVLTKLKIDVVHRRIRSTQVPVHIGRIPYRIDSGATFTAEQWMNWTLYYSVYCLYDLLNKEQMECWRAFVLACRLLCKKRVSEEDVKVADLLLIQFCKRIKTVFGSNYITPNMHMHLHLSACLQDYGPLHAFWLYAFERYNGLLGKQPNNNRSIESQLINRFLRDNINLDLLNSVDSTPLAEHFRDVTCSFSKQFPSTNESRLTQEKPTFELPKKYTLMSLDVEHLTLLRNVYSCLHPDSSVDFHDDNWPIPSMCKKFSHIQFSGSKLSSMSEVNENKVPWGLAIPCERLQDGDTIEARNARPIKIDFFIQHSCTIDNDTYSHIFAICKWPQEHPSREVMGKPVEVWCLNSFDDLNPFVSVEWVTSQAVTAVECLNSENVLVVIPFIS